MTNILNTLNTYDFVEESACETIMPLTIDKIGGIGSVDNQLKGNVEFFGTEAKGMDCLEVIDTSKLFESSESNEETGEESGEQSGEQNPDVEPETNVTENPEGNQDEIQ